MASTPPKLIHHHQHHHHHHQHHHHHTISHPIDQTPAITQLRPDMAPCSFLRNDQQGEAQRTGPDGLYNTHMMWT